MHTNLPIFFNIKSYYLPIFVILNRISPAAVSVVHGQAKKKSETTY